MQINKIGSSCRLLMTDINRLPVDTVTYCNGAGTALSWIDHFLCSPVTDELVQCVNICMDFVSSDHKPLVVTFNNLAIDIACDVSPMPASPVMPQMV